MKNLWKNELDEWVYWPMGEGYLEAWNLRVMADMLETGNPSQYVPTHVSDAFTALNGHRVYFPLRAKYPLTANKMRVIAAELEKRNGFTV